MLSRPALFDRPPLVETQSLDQAEEVYARFNTPIRITHERASKPFSWRAHLETVGRFDISVHRYGGEFSAGTDFVGDMYSYSLPLGDVPSESVIDGNSIALVRNVAGVITSPGQAGRVRFGEGHTSMQMKMPRSEIETAFIALTGDDSPRRIQFAPRLALAGGYGAALLRLSHYLADEAGHNPSLFSSPAIVARLADTLVYTMLLGIAHDGSPAVDASGVGGEPEHVRLAAEYLDAHAARPVRMAELAKVTGVSLRAVQLAFRRHRGCSPTEFLLERRLVASRVALLTAPQVPITRVAFDHGFAHLGRFSSAYRKRFGETPTQSRARAR